MNKVMFFLTAALAVLASPCIASAAECGYIGGTSGNDTIVVGVAMEWNSSTGMWQYVNGTPRVGYCRRNEAGLYTFGFLNGCTLTTPAADWVMISPGAGDDTVGIHPAGAAQFTCGGLTYAIAPGPWRGSGTSGWAFQVKTTLGSGFDRFYGSPNTDWAYSNDFASSNDSANDIMCTYAGADVLIGDGNDATDFECMDGWTGNDYYNGFGESPEADLVSFYDWANPGYWTSASLAALTHWCTTTCGGAPPVLM